MQDRAAGTGSRADRARALAGRPATLYLVVAIAYAVGAEMSWALFGAADIGLAFFPPAGVTAAALLLNPRRRWPALLAAVVVAEVAVDAAHGLGLGLALGYAAANAAEPVVGALVVRHILRRHHAPLDLRRRLGAAAFCAGAVAAGPAAGALVGGSLKTWDAGTAWWVNAAAWWAGDALGVLAVGCPIVLWVTARVRPARRDLARLAAAATIVSVVAALATSARLAVLLVPPLLWVAFRYSPRISVTVAGIAAFGINVAVAEGAGPFARDDWSPAAELAVTQVALGIIVLTTWWFAVEIFERHEDQVRLRGIEAARAREEAAREARDLAAAEAQRLALALEAGSLATYDVDLRAGTATATGLERLVGVSPDEVDSAWWLARMHPDDRPAHLVTRESHLRAGGRQTVGYRVRHEDGRWRTVEDHRIVIHEGTEPVRMIGVVRDVTEERRRAEQLAHTVARERAAAHALQQAMLGQVDAVDGLACATAYAPAANDLEVGGDWYDAVALPDGRCALVLGDVVGHHLEAATVMGQLRSAVRALSQRCDDPAEVLAEVDRYAEHLAGAVASTVVVVVVDPARGGLRFATAGHPPPLLVHADGDVSFLTGGRRPPLGVPAPWCAAGHAVLERGDTLVLYSDGLVERRDETLDVGLDRLRHVATMLTGLEPGVICTKLVDGLTDPRTRRDDVAVLVARLTDAAQPATPSFPSLFEVRTPTRATLRPTRA